MPIEKCRGGILTPKVYPASTLQAKVRHAGAALEVKNDISHSTARHPTHQVPRYLHRERGKGHARAGSNSVIIIHLDGRDPTFEEGNKEFLVTSNQETGDCNSAFICLPEEAPAKKRVNCRDPKISEN